MAHSDGPFSAFSACALAVVTADSLNALLCLASNFRWSSYDLISFGSALGFSDLYRSTWACIPAGPPKAISWSTRFFSFSSSSFSKPIIPCDITLNTSADGAVEPIL